MKPSILHRLAALCLATGLAAPAARAQFVIAKVGGGLSKTYSSTRVVGSYKLGLAYEYEVGGNWSLEAGAYYHGKGYKEHNEWVPLTDEQGQPVMDEAGQPRYGKMNRSVSAQYVAVPVLAHYYMPVADRKYVVWSFGPYLAVGVGGKDKYRGDATQTDISARYYHDDHTFSVSGTHRFDVGAEVGVGYQWMQQLTVGLEADLGLLRLRPGRRNVGALVTLAYRFRTDGD